MMKKLLILTGLMLILQGFTLSGENKQAFLAYHKARLRRSLMNHDQPAEEGVQ